MANCPECEALLEVDEDEVEEGDVISCAECGLDLEVVHQSPLEVERLDEEEEDDTAEAATFDEDNDKYDDDDDADDDDDDDEEEEE
jgi:alpha-aminoadipate carrier protein LysW